ncbi:protein farnesyltransferase subunit beta-like [Brassica napus]|nr:PREDICTED: protein farnesyltransferase subunit beta-like [Brassica oleracea var. oleracea]XP_022557646.1 protein farnesyltransferase subunit beta-like [Brassica napus]
MGLVDGCNTSPTMKMILKVMTMTLMRTAIKVPEGGFRDKPGKPRDFYHTCYCLSGLSVAQHAWSKDKDTPPLNSDILGSYANHLEHVHLLHNVVMDRYNKAIEFFHRAV